MSMWVFRVGLGRDGGAPRSKPPDTIRSSITLPDLSTVTQTPIGSASGQEQFIVAELFQHGRLRQGWGVPGLDLRRPQANRETKPAQWIEAFIRAAWRYWNEKIDVEAAYGRWLILMPMEDSMQTDDIVFVPNVGPSGFDTERFTVATVCTSEASSNATRPYYFEDRTSMPDTWQKDFAHVIPIRNVRTYHQSGSGLSFGAPYLYALSKIERQHQRHSDFWDFVLRRYGNDH